MDARPVVYDANHSVWKFGNLISRFPDDMLTASLVFNQKQLVPLKSSKSTPVITIDEKYKQENIILNIRMQLVAEKRKLVNEKKKLLEEKKNNMQNMQTIQNMIENNKTQSQYKKQYEELLVKYDQLHAKYVSLFEKI